MKNTIQTLLLVFVVLLVLVGCAKNPKPWDNPELIKIEREDVEVLFSDVTMWGYVVRSDGSRGPSWKTYFKEDGTSEIIVWPGGRLSRGWWDTSDPNATYCAWYKNLKGGRKDCWLLYKKKDSDWFEYYYHDGRIRGITNKTQQGYHM